MDNACTRAILTRAFEHSRQHVLLHLPEQVVVDAASVISPRTDRNASAGCLRVARLRQLEEEPPTGFLSEVVRSVASLNAANRSRGTQAVHGASDVSSVGLQCTQSYQRLLEACLRDALLSRVLDDLRSRSKDHREVAARTRLRSLCARGVTDTRRFPVWRTPVRPFVHLRLPEELREGFPRSLPPLLRLFAVPGRLGRGKGDLDVNALLRHLLDVGVPHDLDALRRQRHTLGDNGRQKSQQGPNGEAALVAIGDRSNTCRCLGICQRLRLLLGIFPHFRRQPGAADPLLERGGEAHRISHVARTDPALLVQDAQRRPEFLVLQEGGLSN